MIKRYYEQDGDLSLLKGKKIQLKLDQGIVSIV